MSRPRCGAAGWVQSVSSKSPHHPRKVGPSRRVARKDPRLNNQERYLKRATLHCRPYFIWQPDWTHDHCEFCWAAFVVAGDPGASNDPLTEGWTTEDEYHWVCDRCFEDFHQRFEWKTRERRPTDRLDTPPPTLDDLKADRGNVDKSLPTRRSRKTGNAD